MASGLILVQCNRSKINSAIVISFHMILSSVLFCVTVYDEIKIICACTRNMCVGGGGRSYIITHNSIHCGKGRFHLDPISCAHVVAYRPIVGRAGKDSHALAWPLTKSGVHHVYIYGSYCRLIFCNRNRI